jgi:hypothetical protein
MLGEDRFDLVRTRDLAAAHGCERFVNLLQFLARRTINARTTTETVIATKRGDSRNSRGCRIMNTFQYIDFIPLAYDIALTRSRQGKSRERHEAGTGGGGREMG